MSHVHSDVKLKDRRLKLEVKTLAMTRWSYFKCRSLFPFPTRLKSYKLLILLGTLILLFLLATIGRPSSKSKEAKPTRTLRALNSGKINSALKAGCHFHTCFDINLCAIDLEDRIRVHVYDHYEYTGSRSQSFVPTVSDEYSELLTAVKQSRFYEPDITKACVFIPSLDTLSQSKLDVQLASVLLNSQPSWNDGQNHLVFNMLPGSPPHYNSTPDFYYGKAMIAGGSFSRGFYRDKFDISIPVYNPLTRHRFVTTSTRRDRPYLLTVLTHGWHSQDIADKVHLLLHENKEDVLLLETNCPQNMVPDDQLPWKRCDTDSGKVYPYLETLKSSQFCLLIPGLRLGSPDFLDILMTGCIPVVLDDNYVLPFSEVLDWSQASIRCWSHELVGMASRLRDFPHSSVREMHKRVSYFYKHYFSSMAAVALTTLTILNERVFPTTAQGYELWTTGRVVSRFTSAGAGLDLLTPTPDEGFTAVILTFNRVSELFKAIESVAAAPSLAKILVVWNNVDEHPPSAEEWPRIKKPIQVIRSKKNKLSNRFFPYKEIQTAAVFSLDDDITMLTADELEFGYKAWQEFPNRLVGFPGRVHTEEPSLSNHGKWKYDSSWLNNVSLVLTGASFYHNYYNYLYTYVMPARIREWVDRHMNCEDIAMNFLIANHTALPPLKVSPRKKFTCPTCTSEESLWNDPEHYLERDECINIFEQFFKGMPLQTVKFRLDPLLYKEPIADRYKAFPDLGEL